MLDLLLLLLEILLFRIVKAEGVEPSLAKAQVSRLLVAADYTFYSIEFNTKDYKGNLPQARLRDLRKSTIRVQVGEGIGGDANIGVPRKVT